MTAARADLGYEPAPDPAAVPKVKRHVWRLSAFEQRRARYVCKRCGMQKTVTTLQGSFPVVVFVDGHGRVTHGKVPPCVLLQFVAATR